MPKHDRKKLAADIGKSRAVVRGSRMSGTAKAMKVKKRLTELGADPRLVRRAKGSWLGQEKQAIKTFKRLTP